MDPREGRELSTACQDGSACSCPSLSHLLLLHATGQGWHPRFREGNRDLEVRWLFQVFMAVERGLGLPACLLSGPPPLPQGPLGTIGFLGQDCLWFPH